MRKWIREHPTRAAVLVFLAVWLLIMGVNVAVHRRLDDALFNSTFYALFMAGGMYLQQKRMRKTGAKLAADGKLLLWIRYPDARPGSLSSIWNMVVTTAGPGETVFQPAVYDTAEPSGRPVKLRVLELAAQRRETTGQDRKYITDRSVLAVMAVTDKGRLEIAGTPENLDQLSAAIASAARSNESDAA